MIADFPLGLARVLVRSYGSEVLAVRNIIRLTEDPPERHYDAVGGWEDVGAARPGVTYDDGSVRAFIALSISEGWPSTTLKKSGHQLAFLYQHNKTQEITAIVFPWADLKETGDAAGMAGEARLNKFEWTVVDNPQKFTWKPHEQVRVYAETKEGMLDITEGVEAMYDVVVGSLDFSSGFISYEDAVPIAKLGEILGFETDHPHMKAYIDEQRRQDEISKARREGRDVERINPDLIHLRRQLGQPVGDDIPMEET